MKGILTSLLVLGILLTSCQTVNLNASIAFYATGVDPNTWAQIPAGEFYFGQHEEVKTTDAYEIMVTNVTTSRYAGFLTAAPLRMCAQ